MRFEGHQKEECGARIIGKIRLEQGDKITVALGQNCKGNYASGCGATFVIKETGKGPEPLFVAGGAGGFKASLAQTANRNQKICSSGIQVFQNGEKEDFFLRGCWIFRASTSQKIKW